MKVMKCGPFDVCDGCCNAVCINTGMEESRNGPRLSWVSFEFICIDVVTLAV